MANMKFKDLKERHELLNKVRSIKDLVNYVGLEPPSHPNYSILLGAGASVTSGIRSGGHLVDEWRQEIYEQLEGEYYDNSQTGLAPEDVYKKAKATAVDYLIREHGAWYNPQNEYSSLFERKFDLPSQRRRFVENLVDGKLPSIGYLYLITLVNKGYFNTFFTTNFDDLINEAFYQFSNTRPLICAHDSAVGSISVTSKRPKIIKLHGDYLFDDIKNTIKETESLEQNTKEKFIEFSKDNGLIVVGYSGQDRSILDVINYLLQQEEYLKNGLYWCFRPDDEITHEVRKILWKDKVYCVEIDGFDELFAEFSKIVKIKPNLLDDPTDSKREQCIKGFIENYQKAETKKDLFKDFIEEISTVRSNQDISELIRQLNENKTTPISQEKLKYFLEIESLINQKKLDEALNEIDKRFEVEADDELRESLFSLKLKIYKIRNENAKAIHLIDSLIKSDEFNIKYHQWKQSFLESLKDKILYASQASKKIPYSVSIKNNLVRLFIAYHKSHDDKIDLSFDDCEKVINESLKLDSSLDNDIYELKLNFLSLRLSKEGGASKDKNSKIKSEIDDLIKEVISINKYHPDAVNIRRKNIFEQNNIEAMKVFVKDLEILRNEVSKARGKKMVYNIAILYNHFFKIRNDFKGKGFDAELEKEIDNFFTSYLEDELRSESVSFHIEVFSYYVSKYKYNNSFLVVLKKILNMSDCVEYIKVIFDEVCLLGIEELNNCLEDFLKTNKSKLNAADYYYCMSELAESNKNYVESCEFFEKHYAIESKDNLYYITYTYELLVSGKFVELSDFVNEYAMEISCLPKVDKSIIDINLITAKKIKDGYLSSEDKSKLSLIIGRKDTEDKTILICANSLLGQNDQALFHMKEKIRNDYSLYYKLMKWPAISEELKKEIKIYFDNLEANTSHGLYVA